MKDSARATPFGQNVSGLSEEVTEPYSVAADIAGDGMVGAVGYVILSGAWMFREGDGNWDARCDFNGNGIVAADFALISRTWTGRPRAPGTDRCAGTGQETRWVPNHTVCLAGRLRTAPAFLTFRLPHTGQGSIFRARFPGQRQPFPFAGIPCSSVKPPHDLAAVRGVALSFAG